MKILVVDREEISAQMIRSKLMPLGHEVVEERVKNNAIEHLAKDHFDMIFLDPSPLTSARPVVLNIRRSVTNYPYILLMSQGDTKAEALKAGANDIYNKPLDLELLEEKTGNARRLVQLIRRIGDDSEDFPSAGGVIAKSAFNQLFLSAIDRADRYGEGTYVLFIAVTNYQKIFELDGPYAADYIVAKLSQNLVRMRRQSDIIGQTARYEYALMLQRPMYETEPVEAANRFAEELAKQDLSSSGGTEVELSITLINLPIGSCAAEHHIAHKAQQGAA